MLDGDAIAASTGGNDVFVFGIAAYPAGAQRQSFVLAPDTRIVYVPSATGTGGIRSARAGTSLVI
jgi:hypothetical protein